MRRAAANAYADDLKHAGGSERRSHSLALLGALMLAGAVALPGVCGRAAEPAAASDLAGRQNAAVRQADASYRTEALRGRIVWMSEALARRFAIKTVPEAAEQLLALETPEGELHPIVEDVRGRAFRRDERLRTLADCELLVRRYGGSPMVQVIRLFAHEDGHKYELDYWCEICAIAMFERKPCDCCQGETELRRQRVEEAEGR